jgi:hypothetical protein
MTFAALQLEVNLEMTFSCIFDVISTDIVRQNYRHRSLFVLFLHAYLPIFTV